MSDERILAVITPGDHIVGSDRWRIVVPFQALRSAGYDAWWAPPEQLYRFQGRKLIRTCLLARGWLSNERAARTLSDAFRLSGTSLVYDIDDRLDHLDKSNPFHERNPAFAGNVRMMNRASLITVTTAALAMAMREYTNTPVVVLPNRVTRGLFTPTAHDRLTVGLGGSPSHVHDWNMIRPSLERVIARHHDVRFLTYGAELGFSGPNVEHRAWQSWDEYRKTVGEADIGLCPLTNSLFNRGKSPLKWIEFGSLGVPCVVSPTVYGDVVLGGYDALIARSADDWEEQTERLICDESLRQQVGLAARHTIDREWTESEETLATRWNLYIGGSRWNSERSLAGLSSSPRSLRLSA